MPDGGHTVEPLSSGEFAQMMAACVRQDVRAMAVAVSGGADSMALCLLAAKWAAERGLSFVALSVDHGLRPEAKAEAEQVGAWLQGRRISHHILTWQGGAARSGAIQERARTARYDLMRDWCQKHGVGHILLGHHLEDQAETVLMRLRKGSGLMGLAGMAPAREHDGMILLRPLLDVPKARLRATLKVLGQTWVEDPSNQNRVFERVRIRQLLDHLKNEGVSAHRLAGAARACAQVRRVLEAAADALIAQAIVCDGGLKFERAAFLARPGAVREVVLMKLLAQVGGREYPPATSKRERLLSWMLEDGVNGGLVRTLAGCEIRRQRQGGHDMILIIPEGPRKNAKNGENAGNNCESALAPDAQTPYIQGNS